MAIDFPPNPVINEELTAYGRTWIFDGQKWLPSVVMGPPGTPGGGQFLPLTGGMLTGATADTELAFNRSFADVGENRIVGKTFDTNRWTIKFGAGAETGTNTGSNFHIDSHDDAGNFLDNIMSVIRETGDTRFHRTALFNDFVTFNMLPSFPGGAPNEFLTTDGAGNISWITADYIGEAPIDGNLYVRSNATWDQFPPSTTFLTLAGGTMTGPLILYVPSPRELRMPYLPQEAVPKQYVDDTVANYLPLVGGTLTGQTIFTNAGAPIMLEAPDAATGVCIASRMGGSGNLRWITNFADGTAETGGNTGSNFNIIGFDDTGNVLNIPLAVNRASGMTTFSTMPSIPGGLLGDFITTDGAGNLSWLTAVGGGIGNIGELLSNRQTNNITILDGVVTTVTSINLPAGSWDMDGEVVFNIDAVGATMLSCAISHTSAVFGMPIPPLIADSITTMNLDFAGGTHTIPVRAAHVSNLASTTYYLLAQVTSNGPITVRGGVYARRVVTLLSPLSEEEKDEYERTYQHQN